MVAQLDNLDSGLPKSCNLDDVHYLLFVVGSLNLPHCTDYLERKGTSVHTEHHVDHYCRTCIWIVGKLKLWITLRISCWSFTSIRLGCCLLSQASKSDDDSSWCFLYLFQFSALDLCYEVLDYLTQNRCYLRRKLINLPILPNRTPNNNKHNLHTGHPAKPSLWLFNNRFYLLLQKHKPYHEHESA